MTKIKKYVTGSSFTRVRWNEKIAFLLRSRY